MDNVDASTDMRREHWPLSPRYPDSQVRNAGCETYCVLTPSVERYFVPVFHTSISKVIFRLKLSSGAKLGSNAGLIFPDFRLPRSYVQQ